MKEYECNKWWCHSLRQIEDTFSLTCSFSKEILWTVERITNLGITDQGSSPSRYCLQDLREILSLFWASVSPFNYDEFR